MSGSFDFPPASHSNPGVYSQPEHASSRHRRYRRRSPAALMYTQSSRARVDSYHPIYQRNEDFFDPRPVRFNDYSLSSSRIPTSAGGSRYRPHQRESGMRRSRDSRSGDDHRRRNSRYPQQNLDRPGIGRPLPDLAPDSRTVRTHAVEFGSRDHSNELEINESNRRRSKTRRLDNGVSGERYAPCYGHRGQVVPGTLKMELIDCDIGSNEGSDTYYQGRWSECFPRSKSNFILRHQGETAFFVKRITITAPAPGLINMDSGSEPLHQYGAVYVCMDNDDLVSRARRFDCFQIFHSPSSSSSGAYLALDFDTAREIDVSLPQSRRGDPVFTSVIPPPPSSTIDASIMPYRPQDSPSDISSSPPSYDAIEALAKKPILRPSFLFETTVDHHDHSSDDEEEQATSNVQNLIVQARHEFLRSIGATSDDESNIFGINERPGHLTSLYPRRPRNRPRNRPSPSQGNAPGDRRAGSSNHREEPKEVLEPHAVFQLDKGPAKVNISFEPPVSGRFILLKLWNAKRGENVDIESIVVMGWAGPRFFPASQLM